ncbi:uncharacterized protein LOC121966861, partial [Plectropomus leopardus]|uniref:uncharacterized protein LOC121966861 n=1 Tax=Plectropomus leopardus TaxID=160734 RepID=UPI001C4A8CF3
VLCRSFLFFPPAFQFFIHSLKKRSFKKLFQSLSAQKHHEPLLSCSLLETLFCPADSRPSHFSEPLFLTLSPLCVSRHSAILCWCQIQRPGVPLPASVTDLLQRVSQHEDAIREGIRKALESPPPSVSSVSESMEDLQVQPADSGCCGGEGCKDTDCCRNGDKMDLDVPHQQQKFSSGSTDGSSGSSESLNELVQRCVDLVSELGLPQELVSHIQELKDM